MVVNAFVCVSASNAMRSMVDLHLVSSDRLSDQGQCAGMVLSLEALVYTLSLYAQVMPGWQQVGPSQPVPPHFAHASPQSSVVGAVAGSLG